MGDGSAANVPFRIESTGIGYRCIPGTGFQYIPGQGFSPYNWTWPETSLVPTLGGSWIPGTGVAVLPGSNILAVPESGIPALTAGSALVLPSGSSPVLPGGGVEVSPSPTDPPLKGADSKVPPKKTIITPEMEEKILRGQRKGQSNKIKGGHSPQIKNSLPQCQVMNWDFSRISAENDNGPLSHDGKGGLASFIVHNDSSENQSPLHQHLNQL